MRDLEADMAICEAATPGPWLAQWQSGQTDKHKYTHEVYIASLDDVYFLMTKGDAEFFAAARTGWPETIQELLAERSKTEELTAEVVRLKEAMEKVKWELLNGVEGPIHLADLTDRALSPKEPNR